MGLFGNRELRRKAAEIRKQKILEHQQKTKGETTNVKVSNIKDKVSTPPVKKAESRRNSGAETRDPIPTENKQTENVSVLESTTAAVTDNMNLFVDNIVNPENHPDPVPEENSAPVTTNNSNNESTFINQMSKPSTSEVKTDDEEEEDNDDESATPEDRDERDADGVHVEPVPNPATAVSSVISSGFGGGMMEKVDEVQDVLSEESKVVETIQPPNILKSKIPTFSDASKLISDAKAEEQDSHLNTGYLCGCI